MKNQPPPSRNPNWERIVAVVLAAFVIVIFVILVFYPPERIRETLPIIRFLAAFAAGASASLFAGSLDLESTLPVSKTQIRAAGGFATFILVFFLFLWGIGDSETNSPKLSPSDTSSSLPSIPTVDSPIISQPVTLFNSYPTLALFDPQNPTVPDVLKEALNMENNPLIFKKSPVFQAIQAFILGAGSENYDYVSSLNEEGFYENSSVHKGGITESTDSPDGNFEQSASAYKKDSVVQDDPFNYLPIFVEFQMDLDDAPWTVFYKPEADTSRYFVQYPKLSKVGRSKLTRANFGESYFKGKREWIQKVIRENPDHRGLAGYLYPYGLNRNDAVIGPGCSTSIGMRLLSPYVKFIDIINPGNSPIQFESVTYQTFGENQSAYHLTQVSQRSAFFQTAPIRTEPLSGVVLSPKKHYIIPIEFGFFQNLYSSLSESYFSAVQLSNKTIYLPKPLAPGEYEKLWQGNSNVTEDYAQKTTQGISLSDEFLKAAKSSDSEISIPDFAIGQILKVTSIKINGQEVEVNQPRDEISTSISKFAGIGSCPYLLVYDAKKGYWLNTGNVLVDRNKKSAQDTEIYRLRPDITQVRLEEREPEITYIDSISISYQDTETDLAQAVFLDIEELKANDDNFLVLHEGDAFEINLNQLIHLEKAKNIQLIINGFYSVL